LFFRIEDKGFGGTPFLHNNQIERALSWIRQLDQTAHTRRVRPAGCEKRVHLAHAEAGPLERLYAGLSGSHHGGRRVLTSFSVGYIADRWQVMDADGRVLDPEHDRISLDDDLVFEAVRWQLEVSAVSVPADPSAMVRSFGSRDDERARRNPRARMMARQRMYNRMSRLR
jgi:hypothetical protein